MTSLMNFMETNLMMEIKTEVWMWNLPFVQCGQGGVQPHFKGYFKDYGGSKLSKCLCGDNFNDILDYTQCM